MSIQNPKRGKTIFFAWSFFNPSPQVMSDKLEPIANAQDGNSQLEKARVRMGRVRLIDAFWPAGQNDGARGESFYSVEGKIIGVDFRVNAEFANFSGNELGILRPKIKDEGFIHRWILAEG